MNSVNIHWYGKDAGWSASWGKASSVHGYGNPAAALFGAWRMARGYRPPGRVRVYVERRDQWVGRYADPAKGYDYWCLVPCVVVRVDRWHPR